MLDHAVVWAPEDIQSTARLAFAWLGVEADTPRAWFRKTATLARLLDLVEAHEEDRAVDLPLGAATWTNERVTEIVRRGRAWLEGLVGPPLSHHQ